jgi:hypothetical protein
MSASPDGGTISDCSSTLPTVLQGGQQRIESVYTHLADMCRAACKSQKRLTNYKDLKSQLTGIIFPQTQVHIPEAPSSRLPGAHTTDVR